MKKTEKIVSAAATIGLGILLLVLQGDFIGILMTIIGVALLVFGIVDLIQKFVPPAVIKLVVGVLIIFFGWTFVTVVLYIVAALLLVTGILMLYDKIKKRIYCANIFHTICEYAVPALLILIGFMFLFNQGNAINWIFIVAGILTAVEGGLMLYNAIMED